MRWRWVYVRRARSAVALWVVVAGAAASCRSPAGSSKDSDPAGRNTGAVDAGKDAPGDVRMEPTMDLPAAPRSTDSGLTGDVGEMQPVPDGSPETPDTDGGATDAVGRTAPGTDGAGETRPSASDAADAPMVPWIVATTPAAVFRGDEFVVVTSDVLSMPRARLGTVALDPIRSGATDLTFRVPADFPLLTCEEEVNLVIETDIGGSSPVSLVVRNPGPALSLPPASIQAGTMIGLSGCNLTSVQATLSGRALTGQATATMVTVTIPRDMAAGLATLVFTSDRGRSEFQIIVLPPAPQVVATDLQTVGPDGIVFITTDTTNKGLIDSVRIGDATIPASDATAFKWTDQGNTATTSRLAVRIPATTAVGHADILLNGSLGASRPFSVMVVAPSPLSPPPPAPIVITPEAIDGTFPIGTSYPFALADPGAMPPLAGSIWTYVLRFAESRPDGGSDCTGMGTVTGCEMHCRLPCTRGGGQASCSLCDPNVFDYCHPVTGTYAVNGGSNQIMVTVDRKLSGGTIEDYVGGWVGDDATSAPIANGYGYLVVRSVRTGIQLSIRHELRSRCPG
jgi:hypothetical protein